MAQRDSSDAAQPLVVAKRPPQIDREITPLLRWIAEYGDVDESRVPDIVLQPDERSA